MKCSCYDTWDCPNCVYECEACMDMREESVKETRDMQGLSA